MFKRLTNKPIPSPEYASNGYVIPEMGPRITVGKGQEEQAGAYEKLMNAKRGGCPFAIGH